MFSLSIHCIKKINRATFFLITACLLFSTSFAGFLLEAQKMYLGTSEKKSQTQKEDPLLKSLPKGELVITEKDFFAVKKHDPENVVAYSAMSVDDAPVDSALYIDIVERVKTAQINTVSSSPIKKNDNLLLVFYARVISTTDESGTGRFKLTFDESPYRNRTASIETAVSVTKNWRKFYIPFTAKLGYQTGRGRLLLTFGGIKPQVLEIGGLKLMNYGTQIALEKLPRTKAYYPGIEPDAKWRTAAAQRIEKYRKADFTIRVTDKNGKPVPSAEVTYSLVRHDFIWGGVLNASYLHKNMDTPDSKKKWKKYFKQMFNGAVIENSLKWKFHGTWGKQNMPTALAYLEENNIPLRGHVLMWPGWGRVPKDLEGKYAGKKEEFRQATLDRVRNQITYYTNSILTEWDVLNEPYTEHDFMDILGKDIMIDWFKEARDANPNVLLHINDFSILTAEDDEHQNHFFETIKYLIKNNAPLDGIGFQSHFRAPTPPVEIWKRMERFAKFNKKLLITEFDFETEDREFQAAFTRDFMTIVFSHPQVISFSTWAYWEGKISKPKAALFTKDWEMKPNGKMWYTLVHETWTTDESASSGAEGMVSGRGFKGEYKIQVKAKGKIVTKTAVFTEDGTQVDIVLE
jgi:GH35 family endo-1,4-beta-xylanase